MAGNEQNLTPTTPNPMIQQGNEQRLMSKEYQQYASIAGLGSVFSNFVGSIIDYKALKTDANSFYIQAGEVQLQAKQRANQLRQQFIESTGAYMFGAAQRGIAVQSGSVQSNLRRSAENLGKDVDLMQRNADLQSGALITQGNIAKSKANAMKTAAYTGLVSDLASSYLSYNYAGAK